MPSDSRRLYGNIQATKIANRLKVLPGNNLSSHVIKEVKEDLSGSSGTLKNEMGSKIL